MHVFEYPYVIITILATIFLLMGLIGLYFTMKSVKTAKGTLEKGFCGIGKIENDFNKALSLRKLSSVIYISLSLDSMKRLYSESKAVRVYEQIKKILLTHLSLNTQGEISLYGKENFVCLINLPTDELTKCIENCQKEINEVFVKHSAVGVVDIHFGYHSTSSTEVSFKSTTNSFAKAGKTALNACGKTI